MTTPALPGFESILKINKHSEPSQDQLHAVLAFAVIMQLRHLVQNLS